jgi:predicted dithiol-disulfide oxidoreductase (DUF899 family)
MSYAETQVKLAGLRDRIAAIRKEMRQMQEAIEPQPVTDYTLSTAGGAVRLSELFGDKEDLFVIHNMGTRCAYCTLWADGFNGIYHHLADRAAFVVASPDRPDIQRSFAQGRGWRFPMVSHDGTRFAADMGYRADNGGFLPGVSVFRKDDAGLVRVSDTHLEPGDDFCTMWHLLDLLPEGRGIWQPRFSYAREGRAA